MQLVPSITRPNPSKKAECSNSNFSLFQKTDGEVGENNGFQACGSDHGCCEDLITPAKGPNGEGCPRKEKSQSFYIDLFFKSIAFIA